MDYKQITQIFTHRSSFSEDIQETATSILKPLYIEEGREIKCSYKEYSMLIFVLEGLFSVNSICTECEREIDAGNMFFIPQGRTFYLNFKKNSTLLFCNIPTSIELFNKNPLAIYGKFLKHFKKDIKNDFCVMPIHPILHDEVSHTITAMAHFKNSTYFQSHKRDTFIIYIKNLYPPEEIAVFIKNMLTEDMQFLAKVLDIYHEDITAQEFIEKSGMSASTFNRKFKKTFDINIGQWLLKKKSEAILEDLVTSNLSVHDIAEKHFITPNHLTKFCRLHFHKSPTDIRDNFGVSKKEEKQDETRL